METKSRGIVFLDRDGTINYDSGYVTDPAKVELIPGAAEAIAIFRSKGFLVVVVSNQSAIGRGFATVEDVDATNKQVEELLRQDNSGALVDLWCYAPDHPDNASDLRKPGVGMLREVEKHFPVIPHKCWMVGDKDSDIEFGLNAGIPANQCVLIGEPGSAIRQCILVESLLQLAKHHF